MDHIQVPDATMVLFDGDCGICSSFAEAVKQRDHRNIFLVVPYQNIPEDRLKTWGLSYDECARELQVITKTGRVYSGAFAVNYIFFQYLPWSLFAAAMFAIPIFLLFEVIGYRLVARNRTRISRWFGLQACLRRPSVSPP
jgi:predicted DCC family thiol-disulfide oxidoreductase YuxK